MPVHKAFDWAISSIVGGECITKVIQARLPGVDGHNKVGQETWITSQLASGLVDCEAM